MSDPLPLEVVVAELPDGVRYRLPRRRWGTSAHMDLAALVAGLLGISFMSFWLWLVGSKLFVDGGMQPGEGFLLLFLAMGGWMLLMMLRLAVSGVSRLVGHSEIELRGGTLRGLACWGPLHWSWRRPVAGLIRFEVRDATLEDRPGRVYEETRAATEYNEIAAFGAADEKPVQLAHGYPREWLLPLARDIARRCRLVAENVGTPGASGAAPEIDVAEEPLPNPTGFVDRPEQPGDSRVLVESTGGRLTLTLPRKAFGRQEAVLSVRGDRLRVERRGRRGTGDGEWGRHQLADIRVARLIDSEGPDTFQVHVDPHPGEGKRVGLTMSGEAEARWLATTLRRELRMPDAAEGSAPFLERAEQPAGSRITQDRLSNGVNLIVPPAGYRHPEVRRYLMCGVGYLAIALAAGAILYAIGDLLHTDDDVRGLAVYLWFIPVLFGIGAAVAAEEVVRRARRHATLTVVGDTLLVQQTNLYGTRQREWRRSRVVDIRVGDTLKGHAAGTRARRAVLDRTDPTWDLHIHLLGDEIVRLLDGYGDAELQWLATVLRRALRVPADASPVRRPSAVRDLPWS